MFFKKYTANDWCSSKLKLTPAQCFLENYLQHPKKSYFPDIYTEWNDSHYLVHKMAWFIFDHLCKKAQKSAKKLERKYCNTALTMYVSMMQCKFVTVICITSHIFWETREWKKGEQSEFMSEQSINFKYAETSWFRGLFLAFS